MADESTGATASANDSSNEKVLAALDGLAKRFDSFETESKSRHDSMCSRMDAFEKSGTVQQEGETTAPAAVDGAGGEKGALTEERKENNLSANDSARLDAALNDNKDLRAQLESIRKLIPAAHSADDRPKFVAVQMQAEPVYQAFGDSAGAPASLNGETLDEYRLRLVSKYKGHSKQWANVDLTPFRGAALEQVANQVFADAAIEARNPSNIEPGVLQERHEFDRTGRRITRFVGDPAAAWAPFKFPTRLVTSINTKFH